MSHPVDHHHELETESKHVTLEASVLGETHTEDLVVCALRSCTKAIAPADAIWDGNYDDPYCSPEHRAEGVIAGEISFYEDDLS